MSQETRKCTICNKDHTRKYSYCKRCHANKNRANRLGITMEDVESLLSINQCESCGSEEDKINLVIDHCHKTGNVRGLLCRRCNVALGHLDDDVSKILSLAKYLSR